VWSLSEPLAGQGRLAVAGRGYQQDYSRCRFVEQARQSGPLDYVAARQRCLLFFEFDHCDRALPALVP
jgi:hypothetical protein